MSTETANSEASAATDGSTCHVPDRSRLPDAIADLDWNQHRAGDGYYDNAVLLVAVPIRQRVEKWYYVLAVIEACDNGDYLDWYCNGEVWEWSIDDVDWFVTL